MPPPFRAAVVALCLYLPKLGVIATTPYADNRGVYGHATC